MTLGGTVFIHNAIVSDYCISEVVTSLKEFCDKVIVLDAGSTDGTADLVRSFEDTKTKVVLCHNDMWVQQKGRTKLSYFTNMAASFLTTDYQFNCQADEILHELSYDKVRKAIETKQEAFLIKRINLWASPYLRLDVSHDRKPCSTEVVRVAKVGYQSVDDGEHLAAHYCPDFLNDIRLYHMGFVRLRKEMVYKCNHIQREVFEIEPDAKLKGMDVFDPYQWFSQADLKPIEEPLPIIIQDWAKKRVYDDTRIQ